jgi:hypothetical protein
MITVFKKHMNKPWHKVTKVKRIYENRDQYFRYQKTPKKPVWLIK